MPSLPPLNQNFPQSPGILLPAIWRHLSRLRHIQFGLIFVVMLASAVSELLTLGAVMPFLVALSEPEALWQQPLVNELAKRADLTTPNQLLLPVTILFGLAAVLAALVRIANLWLNGRFAAAVGSDLSCKAYQRTLYQPYEVHIENNTANTITAITSHIAATIVALNAFLQMVTSAVIVTVLLGGLLLVNAKLALAIILFFGCFYCILAIIARRELNRNGQKLVAVSTQQLKALNEGLGAIRDVLLDSSQPIFLQIYRQSDRTLRQINAKSNFLAGFPRFALEALGILAISIFGYILAFEKGSGLSVVPVLGALALGSQRMLPALQQVYSGWAALKTYGPSIKSVLELLQQPLPEHLSVDKQLPLNKVLCLQNAKFSYGPDKPMVLKGLNLKIRSGERIGFIGTTGSGKSTVVDLLMGLLKPTAGQLLVDGKNVHDPDNPHLLGAWQASIAHVPQNVFLCDSSIAENIAFGLRIDQIDMQRVKLSAEKAQIAGFIESSADSYLTFVGERGVRLSGGQRQRIAIARALYKQSSVIVLDEATSALDESTEKAVMDSIENLSRDLTIIIIAHRLSTLQRCDRILRLDHGLIVENGTPQDVLGR